MIDYHVQCKLRKKYIGTLASPNDYKKIQEAFQTTWLPEKYARVGRYVRLRTENENIPWEDGWEVIEADLDHKQESKYVAERERDFKRTRKASDI